MDQRYVISRGGSAFESLAFDPTTGRIAGNNRIEDACGNMVSAGPDQQPGLAYDIATPGWFWQITSNRVVRRWHAGTLVDTVFTIPLTFSVPGSGADTLESPRGIAVDSGFVYVVDAGPVPGTIPSNEWFKFTRAGVPVKSSKSTDLLAHLDLDPDALVDDIVYAPFASRVAPGRLLVALEHSGMQVLDTDGNFVSRMRWSAQSTPATAKPAAFAGLTLDPASGNLFLADNDQSAVMVLTRLPANIATSYVVGTGSNQAWLQYPKAGCELSLWRPLPPPASSQPSLVFGIAYRAIDHNVYGMDYSTGDLWKFDPRSGRSTLVGATGISGIWGMAWDSARDSLYGLYQGGGTSRLFAISPVTAGWMVRPGTIPAAIDDIAYDATDHFVYGVTPVSGNTGNLMRIDPLTGTGAAVHPTLWVRGLDWDAVSGRLIGANNILNLLVRIDPSTGVYDTLSTMPQSIGWEGLAVVPVPGDPFADVLPAARPVPLPSALAVAPNPSRAVATLAFTLGEAAIAGVTICDVAGRAVRTWAPALLAAGPHVAGWDGRADDGAFVAPGVYFARVRAGARQWSGVVVRVR